MTHRIQIKKYGNRRLYDVIHKRFVTQDQLVEMIQDGHEIEVVDSKTGADLTQVVLTQLILEEQKEGSRYLFTSTLLHQLIQYREQSVAEFFQQYLPNILQSYIQWQQEAHQQFLQWARLGWSASRYSQEFFTPRAPYWGLNTGSSKPGPEEERFPSPHDTLAEMERLRKRVEELENRIERTRQQDL